MLAWKSTRFRSERLKMKQHMLIAALGAGVILLARPAVAQFYPGGYGYGGYGGWAGTGAALAGSDYRQAAIIDAKAQSMQAGQQLAAQQNYVVQSGIRNTLSSQAQANANAIQSQQQATQDWWFQHQAQQMAADRAQPKAGGDYATAPLRFGPPSSPPPVNMDIIQWPTLLQEQCFASERAKIEAPYRRTPPKLSVPTPADYREMAATVEDMKAVLEWRLTEGVNTGEYNAASAFLTRLGQEVAARAGAN
jgi:hypothetical protein